ncbi:ferritin-like protein [Muriicola sp. Z0-33]|uniref:ferritin-like protein n=1 Tax=Muriicola sp. Z0-33 TaxID=2816957 RepID=UPI002237AF1C|nr:ferritin-like protein [Muriicola sp. Z0-33]MCW5514731.1 ferritin-like protein [Muriicola sp. Z0-33]
MIRNDAKPKIDTREELILALNEAAEIEHSLLIQYLFASFTLKQSVDEGLNPLELEEVNDWKRTILQVAREEMIHFGSVCNLLSAIGSGPRILRSNFPKRTDYFYGLDAPFELTRFNLKTVKRFTIFELPQGIDKSFGIRTLGFAPDPLRYNKVGELYNKILEAFKKIPNILIGDPTMQDQDGWGLERPKAMSERILKPIRTLKDVEQAIANIVEEGEGSASDPDSIKNSHYGRFLDIKKRLKEINFEPSRDVVSNPSTRQHRDSDQSMDISLITNEQTLKACELFNSLYNSMLISLIQYYSHLGESQTEKTLLKNISWQSMSAIIRPLGEILTQLPAFTDKKGSAGPGFEIYGEYSMSPTKTNRFQILNERWKDHSKSADGLINIHPRMPDVSNKIKWMSQNIDNYTKP